MRSRTRIAIGLFALGAAVVAGAMVYRVRTAGHAEVRDITERVAAAMATGDRAALAMDPALRDHPDTVDWLADHGPALAAGYRVSVQRNGANGYQLLDRDVVSHVGRIETPGGTVSLGFRRDPEGGLTFVTAASTGPVAVPPGPGGGQIRVGRE